MIMILWQSLPHPYKSVFINAMIITEFVIVLAGPTRPVPPALYGVAMCRDSNGLIL